LESIDKKTKIFFNGEDVSTNAEQFYPIFDKGQILDNDLIIQFVNKIYDFNLKDYKITYYKWDLINVDEKIDNFLVYKINEDGTLNVCIFVNTKLSNG
jgi:hypothetical protein